MEEILELDNELTHIKKIMEILFSFKKEPNFQYLNNGKPLRVDLKKIFLEKFDNYVEIHLVTELEKKINKCSNTKESKLKLFIFISKGLTRLYNHFITFFRKCRQSKKFKFKNSNNTNYCKKNSL